MKKIILLTTLGIFAAINLNAQIEIPSLRDGVVFKAKDNTFKAKMNFRIQNLLMVDFANNGGETETNALVRRARLKFGGHIYNEKWKYKFEMGLSNRDIGASSDFDQVNSASRMILDAVVKYQAHKNLQLWFGQTKLPGNRERVISSQALQFVDRSLVNGSFNIDRDMGVQAHYKKSLGNAVVKLKGALSLGEGRNITKGNFGGFNTTGRLEFLPMGEFTKKGDYFSSDLKREKKPKLAFGATYDMNKDASRQGGQLKSFTLDTLGNPFYTDLSSIMIDMMFKYNGWSIMSEYVQKTGDDRAESGALAKQYRTGTGINAQIGYLFKNNFEIAGRYTSITPDDFSSLSEVNEYTLGFSRYIVDHTLKVQTDFSMTEQPGLANSDPAFRWRFQVEIGF